MTEAELKEIKDAFSKQSSREGLCEALKVFTMGSHGTAMVGCGLPDGHTSTLENRPGETYPKHIARHDYGDGSTVTFTWE